jgi:pyruvate/2-oxoglutarate dehydrogenase complex dihydrolipoamide acyltransferase (E2) component
MSTPEETAPPATAAPASDAPEPAADTSETLSPAVRRLVRQFDLDITGIHGTGPEGRIRVGDVMGLLGGRMDSGKRDAPPKHTFETSSDEETFVDPVADDIAEPPPAAPAPGTATGTSTAASTTVFDCDLSRVLSHRKRLRRDEVEVLLTSYFLAALAEAHIAAPELTGGALPSFGVWLTTADDGQRTALVDGVTPAEATLDERLLALDTALREHLDAELARANLLVHHYGESGSLLAAPTPLGEGHAASVGIGRLRREIVVRSIDGVETPRVAARCYLTLSFLADRITLHRANRFMAAAARILEHWPD